MTTLLIPTKEYLLLIDEEAEIKDGELCIDRHLQINTFADLTWIGLLYDKKTIHKIIAFYPLKEAKELDLPLLPNPFEINIDKLALEWFVRGNIRGIIFDEGWMKIFEAGYKAAQSKQFSLEDMKKAIEMAQKESWDEGGYLGLEYNPEQIIQSLSTQQLPKEFILGEGNTIEEQIKNGYYVR